MNVLPWIITESMGCHGSSLNQWAAMDHHWINALPWIITESMCCSGSSLNQCAAMECATALHMEISRYKQHLHHITDQARSCASLRSPVISAYKAGRLLTGIQHDLMTAVACACCMAHMHVSRQCHTHARLVDTSTDTCREHKMTTQLQLLIVTSNMVACVVATTQCCGSQPHRIGVLARVQ